LGIKIKDNPNKVCVDCAKGKTKKKQIAKISTTHATKKGERIAMDISSIKSKSFGGNKYWLMIQDEFTSYVWCKLLKAKSELPENMMKFLTSIMKTTDVKVQYIRCDNSGENQTFQ
jgi:hypothetical protein